MARAAASQKVKLVRRTRTLHGASEEAQRAERLSGELIVRASARQARDPRARSRVRCPVMNLQASADLEPLWAPILLCGLLQQTREGCATAWSGRQGKAGRFVGHLRGGVPHGTGQLWVPTGPKRPERLAYEGDWNMARQALATHCLPSRRSALFALNYSFEAQATYHGRRMAPARKHY